MIFSRLPSHPMRTFLFSLIFPTKSLVSQSRAIWGRSHVGRRVRDPSSLSCPLSPQPGPARETALTMEGMGGTIGMGIVRNSITRLFSQQTLLTKLAYHGWQIVLAALLFTLTSWVVYYVAAPGLIRRTHRFRKATIAKGSQEHHVLRLKWAHTTVSMMHALVVTIWGIYLLSADKGELAATCESRVFGYSKALGSLIATSIGYFVWDLFCSALYVKHYGKGFLIHAILGLGGFSCSFRPILMYATNRFMLFEASTIFVNLHWFMDKFGYSGTAAMLVVDAIGAALYLGVRLLFGSYLSYIILLDLWTLRRRVPLLLSIISLVANLTTHTLNFYWFYKLLRSFIRSALRRPLPVEKKVD